MDFHCEECKRNFDSQQALDQHKKDKHTKQEKTSQNFSMKVHKYVVITVIAIIIIGFGLYVLISHSSSTENTIKYNRDLPKTGFHWHPKLYIYINGKEVTIPANIGLIGGEHPIHTHDTDNVLHYEFSNAPTFEQIRLGNFFKIWGKIFNSTCILDYCNGQNGTVKMYVNGVENAYYDNYIPSDLEKIEIKFE